MCYTVCINKKEVNMERLKQTKDTVVRNIPIELIDKLKKQAKDNYRSMNNEIIAVLEKGVK
jgi:hypothetical protein